jgi:hypothetical protein
MPSFLQRAYTSLFKVCVRKDLSSWMHSSPKKQPIYGVYHIYCEKGWQTMVHEQIERWKASGLMQASDKLFISLISLHDDDRALLDKELSDLPKGKVEIISFTNDPLVYEYPALDFIYARSKKEPTALFYYFHTKGITYQSLDSDDPTFTKFYQKITSWRHMMEYFVIDKWQVAVNVLNDGYETYGCYLFPPFVNGMYAGNFWWTRADYFSKLDALDNKTKADNRFKAEEWLLTKSRKPFSAFDTVADLYFVNITPDIYSSERHSIWASFRFFCIYTFRKYQKKWFGYSYKKHCQERFQKLKAEVRTAPNR